MSVPADPPTPRVHVVHTVDGQHVPCACARGVDHAGDRPRADADAGSVT